MELVRIEKNTNLTALPAQEAEVARVLVNLKQRMKSQSSGKELVSALKIEKMTKEERNPRVSRASLSPSQTKIADLIPNFTSFMEYQTKAWDFIDNFYNSGSGEGLVVSAPTGFGKTEAVLPAVINRITNSDGIAIVIFPRRALLLDQLERISKYVISGNPLRIAIQMGGIEATTEYTIYAKEQKSVRLRNLPHSPDIIDPRRHYEYDFETDFLSVHYINGTTDKVDLKIAKCVCGGQLSQEVYFRPYSRSYNFSSYNFNRRDQNSEFLGGNNDNTTWKCQNPQCNKTYSISLSRDDHINLGPNLIFTTIDSLSSLFSDPEIRDYIDSKQISIVLDEIHVYHGSYGSHAASIISELTSRLDKDFLGVGLSATVVNPSDFAKKIFGKNTTVISPSIADKNLITDAETYYFIKSSSDSNSAGEFYSLKSQAMIQFGILSISSLVREDQKMLVFMDSIDAVSLLVRQTEDAYNNKALYTFRLDSLRNKMSNYNGVECSGFNPGICETGCTIYQSGECWNIVRDNIGVTTPARAKIDAVWAASLPDRGKIVNSRTIYSTSELQLGIDLPFVEHLVQYGTPYTIFDYIQRKGRAGRSIGSKPFFYFVLGDNSNDYLYFAYGVNILNKTYRLPLNPNNRLVKEIHALLNKSYDDAIKQYATMQTPSSTKNYVKKFKSSWYSVLQNINQDFSSFLSSDFAINVPEIDLIAQYPDMKAFKSGKETLIVQDLTQKQRDLNGLMIDGMPPIQYLERGRQRMLQAIDSSTLTLTERTSLITGLDQVVNDVLNDMRTPSDLRNQATELANQRLLLDYVNRMNISNLGSDLGREATKFYQTVSQVAHSSTLAANQEKVRALFYLIQSLQELRTAAGRTLTSEIIKYVLRAQYFYEVSRRNSVNNFVNLPLPPLPPSNYFSTSSREVMMMPRGEFLKSTTTDIKDSIYKLFPFRLNEVAIPGFKTTVKPTVTRNGSNLEFDPFSYMDGVVFQTPSGRPSVLPLSIITETVHDDGVNGVVSFCGHCLRLEDIQTQTCSECGQRLSGVRAYASPIVETEIDDHRGMVNPLSGFYFGAESDVSISLAGVELSIRYQKYDPSLGNYMPTNKYETYVIHPSSPYGYMVNTHSIKIDVSNQKILDLLADFHSTNTNRKISRLDVLHSIAHLWVKCISITTGITDEFFTYHLVDNDGGSAVMISEFQEGGAGYLEIFVDLLTSSTNLVLASLRTLVNCEEHHTINADPIRTEIYNEIKHLDLVTSFSLSKKDQIVEKCSTILTRRSLGEISEHYPTCYDGCPYCIGISNCTSGREEQLESLSLQVAGKYVETLTIRLTDSVRASELITRGGVLVEFNGVEYVIFLL